MSELTLGDQMWLLHTTFSDIELTPLLDLASLPQKMREIEKKYRILPTKRDTVDGVISSLFAKVDGFVKSNRLQIRDVVTFVGIDQYFIFDKEGGRSREFHFRYRSGANRTPQLSVKYKMEENSNVIRGEINLPIERAHPDKVRAFMSAVAAVANKPPFTFAVQQSGQIWTVIDPGSKLKVEVVVYRVRRPRPTLLERAFIEIEPVKFPTAEQALKVIDSYEKGLKLKRFHCPQSIAELFRPGNEWMMDQAVTS